MRIPRTVSGPIRRASFALLFIGLLPATTAWAQDTLIIRDTEVEDDDEPARIRIGIKGGFNFATFSNAAPNLDRQTGFAAGASLPIRLNDILDGRRVRRVQTELRLQHRDRPLSARRRGS